jgi:hypothetical protein
MLPASSLSSAAQGLRNLFLQNIADVTVVDNIRIGHPADNIKELVDLDDHCLNLFFYDVAYDGYPVDGSSENPFYVRLHCLITAVSHQTTEPESPGSSSDRDVSKGENELRLIGEVMRILHQQPLISISDPSGQQVAMLQVVPNALNLDNLNHIWSTQNDVSYRLSVAYEMALAPVPHVVAVDPAPLVGDPRMVMWGAMSRDQDSEREGEISLKPLVECLQVDTGVDNWMPHICVVQTLLDDSKLLHYVFKLESDLNAAIDILIAGKAGGTVKLFWNVWRKKTDNSVVAWKEAISDTQVPLGKVINAAAVDFEPGTVDPANINNQSLFQVLLPDDIKGGDTKTWQAVLFAVHEWTHPDPIDTLVNITSSIQSNTLLLYGGNP